MILVVFWEVIFFFCSLLFFWPHRVACGILVPLPGIEPTPPAVEAWSLNHWTAREVLGGSFLVAGLCMHIRYGANVSDVFPVLTHFANIWILQ